MVPWYRAITREQWRVLAAAKLGWMLDAMDFMLYAMAIGQLRTYFGFNDATAGMLGTITLVMSGVGGVLFGYVADRLGRTRALMATILLFSIASLGASTSQTVVQLLFWRALLGIGMGGEWASGAVLISETWPPAHRNKAISIMQSGWAIGYITAALMAAVILGAPDAGPDAWRWLFLVGVLPALFTLWIRRYVREPDVWTAGGAPAARRPNPFSTIFGPELVGRTLLIILLGASVQFAYWGIFFWLPAFLSRPVAQGGAGMGVVGSLGWLIPVQIGAYFGYLTFGFIADHVGRRRTFILFMLAAALLVPVYGQMARNPVILMLLGPVLGYFGHGYFSLFGSFIAELFPTAVRATAQGTSYNIGRMAGALAPYTIGAVATLPGIGIGLALATTSAFFLLGAALILTLPDRSGEPLEA
ncbi:MAG: MFS transporter [Acidobacteria bacterium]|nr:MFS transporter [Acidobacteriota bacterium]